MMAGMNDQAGKRLERPIAGRWLAGVAAGLGQYLGMDPTIIRVIFVIAAFFSGFGIIVYLAAWVIIPEQGESQSILERFVRKTGS